MSRSYKKTPYYGLRKDQFYKRYSNKKIRQWHRQHKDIPDGNAFRKLVDSWNICDFHHVFSLYGFMRREANNNSLSVKDAAYFNRLWFKLYKGK